MTKTILFVFVLFIITSCVPQRVKKDLTYCFDNNETELGSLINLEGFYYERNNSDTFYNKPEESPTRGYIIYPNGFFTTKHPMGWLNSNIEDKYSFFGKYNLINDTIKAQFLGGAPGDMSISKCEVWFKIIDMNTIEMIYYGDGNDSLKDGLAEFKLKPHNQEHGAKFVFYPLKKLPDINKTYIIKRKWFWCDKTMYKKWKKQHK